MSSLLRRRFLQSGLAATGALALPLIADEPEVNRPRATDGDRAYEPNWKEKMTITVGPGGNADLTGKNDRVLQAAVDYIAARGGGTVKVLPGTYTLRSAIRLVDNVRILGSGLDSIITKIPSETFALTEDSDWYDQEVTVAKSSFRVGDSIVLRAKNPHNGGQEVIKRRLVARDGNRFKLDKGLRKNLWLTGKPTMSSLFPLFTADYAKNFAIENICLDGNKKNNENFNGNYGGCVFLQDCSNVKMTRVTARNYNGDGISFQICHDVILNECHSHDNQDLGIHPGSGSQRPRILRCKMERNNLGLFWCWGVKFGLAEHNQMLDNRSYGISIGHNDTNNVMRHNLVKNSGKVGVLFRNDSRGKDFWANRNIVENNQIINSGDKDGVAVDVQGKTKDVKIRNNDILEKRDPMNRTAIRIDQNAERIDYQDNRIEGFKVNVKDMRKA